MCRVISLHALSNNNNCNTMAQPHIVQVSLHRVSAWRAELTGRNSPLDGTNLMSEAAALLPPSLVSSASTA